MRITYRALREIDEQNLYQRGINNQIKCDRFESTLTYVILNSLSYYWLRLSYIEEQV